MGSIPTARFRRELEELDGATFASFVADLWAATGWDIQRRGQTVVATREELTRRLLVLPPRRLSRFRSAPTADADVDAVVTARADPDSLPRGTPDADVVDADALRERLLYALSKPDADSVLQSHVSVPAWDSRWDPDGGSTGRPRLGPVSVPAAPSTQAAALGSVAVTTVAVVLVGLVAISGTAFAPPDLVTDDPDGTETAEQVSPALAAAPDEPDDDAVYDVEPTCERDASAVAEDVSAALTGGEKNRALRVYWDFSNPDHREQTSYSAYVGILRDAFEPLFEADRIEHGEPEQIDDDRVRIEATVIEDDGDRLEYEYELRQWSEEPYDGCWVVDQLAPN